MILKGNQRGGAKDMAVHLMKPENEHVEIYEIRGFASETLKGAFNEVYALSKATRCKQFLYSLSANPPPDQLVSTDYFIDVINRAEKDLGLNGQARVIVFHEKKGRRHAHCVWSRIDAEQLKAVPLPFTKRKLMALSRNIFVEQNWTMPDGMKDVRNRDPLRYTLAEYQQAKRLGQKPRDIKARLQSAWASSDSLPALKNALREQGYWLAKGDRRGFVVLDHHMKPYALGKWLGLRAKVLRDRLGKPDSLPTIDQTKADISFQMRETLSRLSDDVGMRAKNAKTLFENRRQALVERQRAMRDALRRKHQARQLAEAKAREERFRSGLGGLWDRVRGEHARIRKKNEADAYQAMARDRVEMDAMIARQLKERQRIELFKLRHRDRASSIQRRLDHDRQSYVLQRAPEP